MFEFIMFSLMVIGLVEVVLFIFRHFGHTIWNLFKVLAILWILGLLFSAFIAV